METLKSYLKQSSTYKGLALLASLAGYAINPALFEVIGAGVVGLLGVWETVRNQRND